MVEPAWVLIGSLAIASSTWVLTLAHAGEPEGSYFRSIFCNGGGGNDDWFDQDMWGLAWNEPIFDVDHVAT